MLLWTGDHEFSTRWSLTFLVVLLWVGFAFALRSAVIRPLQTLSNMQSALREGDFSFRVRGAKMGDALGELMLEVNTLSEMLREQRLGAMEASALLTTVMTEIEVAVFAFDGDRRVAAGKPRRRTRDGSERRTPAWERALRNWACWSAWRENRRAPWKRAFPGNQAVGGFAARYSGREASRITWSCSPT